ncbi:uncharacterized protein LOC126837313 [Adelges cooleyi]|uniref:uncharacterized protein LOC126837313 n=1 Tax=Adelges cooleyi TaxID=133065 RepID=UPI002180467E|nr:uncharacterized protein LOC126837313 [Adelges cooleyi]
MHFKSAVILCMLYFVTVTQSAGLNERQVGRIVILFKDHESLTNHVSREAILDVIEELGMKDKSGFTYNTDVSDARKAQDLLIFLADNDKKTDCWKENNVSSYEVKIIVTVFREFDKKGKHDGLIDHDELEDLITALSLGEKFKNDLAHEFSTDYKTINAAELVRAYFNVKPKDGVLDKTQVDELVKLKDNQIGNHINPEAITAFFLKLSILKEDYKGHLVFTPIRPVALEVQELLVVSAEYTKKDKVGTDYLSIPIRTVRDIVSQFAEADEDKNGKLDESELEKITLSLDSKDQASTTDFNSLLRAHDTNGDKHFDIAEFFLAIMSPDSEESKE